MESNDTDPPTAGGKPGVTFPAKVIGFTDSGHLVLEIESADLAHVQEYVKSEDEYVVQLIPRGPKTD